MFGRKKRRDDPQGNMLVYRCSFCNKTQFDVLKLIAGPGVYICNECVDICVDVIARPRKDSSQSARPDIDVVHAGSGTLSAFCALCRLPVDIEEALPVENRGFICPGCRGEIEAALARTK